VNQRPPPNTAGLTIAILLPTLIVMAMTCCGRKRTEAQPEPPPVASTRAPRPCGAEGAVPADYVKTEEPTREPLPRWEPLPR
jgi:hypothetical protein